MADLAPQLITVSLVTLQIDLRHDLLGTRNTWNSQYDYIVVGAGSAGAVVAHRLTENPNLNVLLLEAGRTASVATDIPTDDSALIASEFDWQYITVPQKNFGLASDGIIFESRGKVIGGTSSINGMVYNRGNKKDFDNWNSTFVAKGWSYAEVFPYFIKSENNSDLTLVSENAGFHGTTGPLHVLTDSNPQPILSLTIQTMNDLGFPTSDINGAQQLGTAIPQQTIDISSCLRSSTGNAYIDPNPHPNNLHILTEALVTKVLFNKTVNGLKAIGVQFIKNNQTFVVNSEKEIIISGGTFNSPQLLQLSGIGPKAHLQSLDIPVLADLPVGDNLQHTPALLVYALIKPDFPLNPLPDLSIQQLYQLYTTASGPLSRRDWTSTYMASASNPVKDWPNLGIGSYITPITPDLPLSLGLTNLTDEWTQYFEPFVGRLALQYIPFLARYRSRGTVRLASNNPLDHPLIDPKYLSNPQDVTDLVEVTKFIFKFLSNSSLSAAIDLIQTPVPGCQLCPELPISECDSYVECLIRNTGRSLFHTAGANRMGDISRNDTVVDPRLRVKNVLGLRVCDASIMPEVTNGPTNAPTIMIGEKCADLIKQDNRD